MTDKPFVVPAAFSAGIALLLYLGMWLVSRGDRVFSPGRVTGVVGRKGHGKTLFMVHELLRHAGMRWVPCRRCTHAEGKRVRHVPHVATNFRLAVPRAERWSMVSRWEDVLALPHGTLLCLDEAHLRGWAPALQSQTLPEHVQWIISQCRKLEIEIYWCSQSFDRVALGLRRQTDEVAVAQRGYLGRMRTSFHEVEDVNGNRVRPGVKPNWRYAYRVTRRLARAYNSFEVVPFGAESDGPPSDDLFRQAAMMHSRPAEALPDADQ